MKILPKSLLFTVAILFGCSSADGSPSDILTSAVTKLKSTGEIKVVLDYVHWPTALQNLNPMQKQVINAQSPEELRGFYSKMFEDPVSMMKQKMEQRLSMLPPEQQEMARASVSRLEDSIKKRMEERKEKLQRTEFTVGEERIDGESATVELSSVVDGKTKSHNVQFVRVDGKWYLPSVSIAEETSASSSPQIQAMPPTKVPAGG